MDLFLTAAALLPAIALMAFVYSRDKIEREPMGLVLRVLFLGAASGIVAGLAESVIIDVFEAILPAGIVMLVAEYFIGVAAVEEACKFACLNTIKRHPEFDYLFDAVVYSVAAALGFAALENLLYVFDPIDGGFETAMVRAVLSVPGHAADGVVMGVFYGMARQRELRGNTTSARTYYWLAFLLPTIEHGFYDAALSTESDFMALVAMAADLAFIAIAFILVKRTAAKDVPLYPQAAATSPHTPMPFTASTANAINTSNYPASSQGNTNAGGAQGYSAFPCGGTNANGMPNRQAPPQSAAASAPASWICPTCYQPNRGNFCINCGAAKPQH